MNRPANSGNAHLCVAANILLRLGEDFDIDIFKHILSTRMNAIDGKMLDAKRNRVARLYRTLSGQLTPWFTAIYILQQPFSI